MARKKPYLLKKFRNFLKTKGQNSYWNGNVLNVVYYRFVWVQVSIIHDDYIFTRVTSDDKRILDVDVFFLVNNFENMIEKMENKNIAFWSDHKKYGWYIN